MFKFISFLVLAGGLFLITSAGQRFQAKAIAVVNPAISEKKALISAHDSLNSITKIIDGPASKNLSDSQRTNIRKAIEATELSITEAEQQVDQSNIIKGVNSLINKVISRDQVSNSCPD